MAGRSRWVAAITRTSTLRVFTEPTGAELAFLEQPQQLDLHVGTQVADFVEKGGAAVGRFHQALAGLRPRR